MKRLPSDNVRKKNRRGLQIIGICVPFNYAVRTVTAVYSQLPKPSILMENMREEKATIQEVHSPGLARIVNKNAEKE
jgi:hypothetical protein